MITLPRKLTKFYYFFIQRQLCLYGFERVLSGHQKGSRFHKNFIRDNFELISEIKYSMVAKSKMILQGNSTNEGNKQESQIPKPSLETSSPMQPRKLTSSSKSIQIPENCAKRTAVTYEKRLISPVMSPVTSYNDILISPGSSNDEQELPLLTEMQDLDELGFFDGHDLHLIDPIYNCDEKVDKTETSTVLLPKLILPTFSPNLTSKDQHHLIATTEELRDAWQKGFEHALSIPLDFYWSWAAKNMTLKSENKQHFAFCFSFII